MVDKYHSDQLKELLVFQINRGIVNLYKKYFLIIQDLKQEHEILLGKIAQETSPDFPQKIDYFSEDKYNYIRKKILDAGNDAIRELEKTLEVIDVRFKEEK
jgi:hypothetical protein|tara:strand:+ start:1009 stop:1311 length:303 start_codon:yes stop_codon:yes gene_type:complete